MDGGPAIGIGDSIAQPTASETATQARGAGSRAVELAVGSLPTFTLARASRSPKPRKDANSVGATPTRVPDHRTRRRGRNADIRGPAAFQNGGEVEAAGAAAPLPPSKELPCRSIGSNFARLPLPLPRR